MKTKLTLRGDLHVQFFSMSFVLVLAVVMTFFSAGRVDATDIFLRFGSGATMVSGESRDKVFNGTDGWNEVSSFNWKVTAESSWTKGGGASVGKPFPQAVEITKRIDAASTAILAAILTGRAFETCEVVIRDTSRLADKNSAETVLRYEFSGIFFTAVNPVATAGDNSSVESIAFVFKTLKMIYRPVDNDGNFKDPIIVAWDVPGGKVDGP